MLKKRFLRASSAFSSLSREQMTMENETEKQETRETERERERERERECVECLGGNRSNGAGRNYFSMKITFGRHGPRNGRRKKEALERICNS